MEYSILEELGLTKSEVKIYLALLEMGNTSAGPLIKRVGMHRAAVYDIINLLIDKGLVHYVIKANRKYFEAQNPERLFSYIDSKKQDLLEKEKNLKKIMPELQLKRKLTHEEQEGTIYKGKKGLKSVFEDMIKEKKPISAFGATGMFKQEFPIYFAHFHNKRAKLKIPMKIIFNENIRKEKREKELKVSQIKYLPDLYATPSTTILYSDKIVVILWSSEPMAFLMRSKQVADSYNSFFELLWKIAKN